MYSQLLEFCIWHVPNGRASTISDFGDPHASEAVGALGGPVPACNDVKHMTHVLLRHLGYWLVMCRRTKMLST